MVLREDGKGTTDESLDFPLGTVSPSNRTDGHGFFSVVGTDLKSALVREGQ